MRDIVNRRAFIIAMTSGLVGVPRPGPAQSPNFDMFRQALRLTVSRSLLARAD
jgi:hypothetical protein